MTNSTIQIKRSLSTNTPNTLAPGELAYSYSSNTLFVGDANSNVISIISNTVLQQAQTVFGLANTANNTANAAYFQANSAYTEANSAYALANTANNTANAAYAEANAAFALANTANNTAAAALPTTGGTINGSLHVTGNLAVDGVVTMTIDGGTF